MKNIFLFGLLIVGLAVVGGCDDDNDANFDPRPQPPQGVFSITGDGSVELWWAGPYERDIASFNIYRAQSPDTLAPSQYEFRFSVLAEDNPDLDLIYYFTSDEDAANATTYWYAISSVDHAGQESDLSAEDIFDTPRPEGVVELTDVAVFENTSGFDFSSEVRVPAGSPLCDVWVDRFDGIFYLNAGDTSIASLDLNDIQDMGFTDDWDVIGWAPVEGYSELGYAEIIEGHTYVLWNDENHFMKMYVLDIDANSVTFQWAYQQQDGNPELIPQRPTKDDSAALTRSAKINTHSTGM